MVFRELKEKINKFTRNLLLKGYDLSKDTRLTKKPLYDVFFNTKPGIRHPEIAPSLPLLSYVHDNSPSIKVATLRLRESIFRRGFEWERKFESKCNNCKKEYEDIVQQCEECGSNNIVLPDKNEIKRADDFFEKCNIYDVHKYGKRKLLHLLKQIEDDINVFDDAYLVGIKEYWQNKEGEIVGSTLHQIVRGNPITMRLVCDEYGEPGGKYFTCLRHRDVIEEIEDKKCPKCGRKLYEVHYVSVEGGGDSPTAYYIGDEVIHSMKYRPSPTYGYSPIVTLWQTALTLTNMTEYIYRSYSEAHLPKGVLAMKTSNPDSAYEFWKDVDDKLAKDPHYIPKMFLEGEGNGTGSGMEFVKFMDTLEEMQYIPVRDEIRRTIASIYGVTNIFIGDTSGVGGLNSLLPLEPVIIKNKDEEIDILPIDALYPSNWSRKTIEPINNLRHINNDTSKSYNSMARDIIDNNIKVLSKLGWTKVKYIQKFKVEDKPCIDVEIGNGSIRITEDHSIFKDGEAFKGLELEIGDKIDIIKPDFNEFNNYSLNEDFAWLMGLFVAEGNAYYGKKSVYPNCDISNNDINIIKKVEQIVYNNFGLKSKIRLDKRGKNYIIRFHRVLSRLIVEHCYWRNNLFGRPDILVKKVPLRILNAKESVKESFLDGYYEGDGTKVQTNTQTKHVCGVHRTLMSGIQFLYHSLGYKTTQLYRWFNTTQDKEKWHKPVILNILSERYSIDKKVENEIYNLDKYNYSGYVYDIETEDHGFVAGVGYCHAHNSESTQIDITNMAAEAGIAVYNEHVMPELLNWLHINDWKYVLQSPFEENLQRELNENQSKVQIAQSMQQLGFDIELGEEDVFEFKYSGTAKKQDFGGFNPQNTENSQNMGVGEPSTNFGANPKESAPRKDENDLKMGIKKEKVYIKHPNEAPKGSKIQRSQRGSLYYERTPVVTPQRPNEQTLNMEKKRRIEVLLQQANEHYKNILDEYKHTKDLNPGHAMSLTNDLEETRNLIGSLQRNYQELFGEQPEVEKENAKRNININIQKMKDNFDDVVSEIKKDVNKKNEEDKIKLETEEKLKKESKLKDGEIQLINKKIELIEKLSKNDENSEIQKYSGEQEDIYQMKKFKTELNNIFEEEIQKIMNSTQKFTGDDIKVFTKKCLDDAIYKMNIHTKRFIEKAYASGQEYVGNLVKQSINFEKIDRDAIDAILSKHVLWNSYENLAKSTSEQINTIITEGFADPKTFSINNLVNKMREVADSENYRLERISRTEVHTAAMKGREISFQKTDPELKNLYKWGVRHDSRTSKTCLDIEKQVEQESNGKGVSLQRLNEIIKEISLRDNGSKWQYRDFQPHISCRSGILRSFS